MKHFWRWMRHLDRLRVEGPQAVKLVYLRYFVGLLIPEAAELLSVSPRTADRLWAFARAWLHREIGRKQGM
jgi:DNA-directed RNA polymerase specialized sigma24 family protein